MVNVSKWKTAFLFVSISVQSRSLSWLVGCLCLAAFPLMPVVGREPNIHLV